MFSEPIYIPRALNTGTSIRQGDLFYSAGLHRNHVLATANTGEIRRGFGKNAGEWTSRVEISKNSPGLHNIPSGLLKKEGEETTTVLTAICQKILDTKEWPEWT